MSMMWLCVGCTRENADNFQSDNVYLSFTVTHETNMNCGVFESDIYYYDIDERKIDKVAVVPYTSQYPLAVYEKKKISCIIVQIVKIYLARTICLNIN